MNTFDEALEWARKRKKSTETVTIAQCPCCDQLIAIYVEQSARQETVPYTTAPSHQVPYATNDK